MKPTSNKCVVVKKQSAKMFAPAASLDKLKCSTCSKYLTHFPVYSSQGRTSICGRCPVPSEQGFIRDVLYECMARFLKFPCTYRNEGCLESFVPGQMPDHENRCLHRLIPCPVMADQGCIWLGTCSEYLTHCEDRHPPSILRDGEFEIDLLTSYEQFSIVLHDDDRPVMVRRKFDSDSGIFVCQAYQIGEELEGYTYHVSFKDGTGAKSLDLPPHRVASGANSEDCTEVVIDTLKKGLGDPCVIVAKMVVLSSDEQKQASLSEGTGKKEDWRIDYEMLAEVECPVCFLYMTAPIYQCIKGHALCFKCKEKVRECPSCKGDIKDTRNFGLEKISIHFNYPCEFTDYGCDFVSKPLKKVIHEKSCLYGPQTCPLGDYLVCDWKGAAKNVKGHIIDTHHDNYLDIDEISIFGVNDSYIKAQDSFCYVVEYCRKLFKLHFRYAEGAFCWALQLIGPEEECKNFKYEIDVVDLTNKNQRLFLRSNCTPLSDKSECFKLPENYVYIKYNQMRSFLTDVFTYKIRLSK